MKTLIGKQGYLFLMNDSARELDVHCKNVCLVNDLTLSRFTFPNYCLFVYPDKSFLYKDYLPDQYVAKYRPALEIYQSILKERCIDLLDCLKGDVYYKTDTHINLKGGYIVYQTFIQTVNHLFSWNLVPKQLDLQQKTCTLSSLQIGIGDLTWPNNLGDQIIDPMDTYYYHPSLSFYCKPLDGVKILNEYLEDKTDTITFIDWEIVTKYVFYVYNKGPKVLIFYDSFLLQSLGLYFDLFEVYFVKDVYSSMWIERIKPDYVFEFRVERFLF